MYLPGHAVLGRILWCYIRGLHGPSRVPREIKRRHRWCLQPSGPSHHPGEWVQTARLRVSPEAGHKLWHKYRLNRVLNTYPHRALAAATDVVVRLSANTLPILSKICRGLAQSLQTNPGRVRAHEYDQIIPQGQYVHIVDVVTVIHIDFASLDHILELQMKETAGICQAVNTLNVAWQPSKGLNTLRTGDADLRF
jgi:hypothetical protein